MDAPAKQAEKFLVGMDLFAEEITLKTRDQKVRLFLRNLEKK